MRILMTALLLAPPALADVPLTGDQFEELVAGKTLTFATGQTPYGTEYYGPDRRVIWSFIGDECVHGEWYEAQTNDGPAICFEYEGDPTPKCWQVFEEDGKIRSEFLNRPGTTILHEAVDSEPLICGGVGA